MKKPLVSVLINSYNGEDYIKKSINSVLSQSYQNWELIFWDNLSEDNTESIVKSYNDERINYFRAQIHASQYQARRLAIKKCSGELIALLDVDDWWDDRKLEKQVKSFESDNIGFSCSNAWLINERGKRTKKIAFKKIPEGNVLNELLKQDFITMSSLMIKKSSYDSLEYGFNPEFEIIGDFDLVLRLSLDNMFGAIQEPLTYYRLHGSNLTYTKNRLNVEELTKLLKQMQKNSKISKSKNFNIFYNNVYYNRGVACIIEQKRFKSINEFKKLNSIYHLIKSLFVFCMPLKIIFLLRNT